MVVRIEAAPAAESTANGRDQNRIPVQVYKHSSVARGTIEFSITIEGIEDAGDLKKIREKIHEMLANALPGAGFMPKWEVSIE